MSGGNGIKIILLGESGVGKTNLINVALDKEFEQNTESSIHSSFLVSKLEYNNKSYVYSLWDTAGQEIYRALNKIFIKGSKVIIFVYAIDNMHSFSQIEFWINQAKDIIGDEKCIMAILANKSDLFEEQVVPDKDGKELAEKHNMKFCVTSACMDIPGVKKFLKELIIDYIKIANPEEEKNLNFKLYEQKEENVMKKKKCC